MLQMVLWTDLSGGSKILGVGVIVIAPDSERVWLGNIPRAFRNSEA